MTLDRPEITKRVLQKYAAKYPTWTSVSVTEIILDTFGGHLAVVAYRNEEGGDNDEICFIAPDGEVQLFGTTEELARDLERKAKTPLLERIFTRTIMPGMIFAFLLLAVFIIGFFPNFHPQTLTILGSVVGVAARFFFGTGKQPA